ncbi:hypothetical protein [Roseococcus sp.]|uniref:hypothetical protein n=1 Tax=Roseococcus sp. TaxID=2109646 RepID=UPI003BAA7F31
MSSGQQISLVSTYSGGDETVHFVLRIHHAPQNLAGHVCFLSIGAFQILNLRFPISSDSEIVAEKSVPIGLLLDLPTFAIVLQTAEGVDLLEGAKVTTSGEVLEALTLSGEEKFFERVQLNYSRINEPRVLELAARASYVRFESNFLVRAAALTVFAHRMLGRDPREVAEQEPMRIRWLLDHALPLVEEGRQLIAAAGEAPDWRHVRWTVSLATVCGYLALYVGDYQASNTCFGVASQHTRFVKFSKVSALNFICGGFMHGILSHMLGDSAAASESLIGATEGVRECVQAQNMLENVWVLGDLIGVVTIAHQCFIALVRLSLIKVTQTPPMIDAGSQIRVALIKGPLRAILQSGLAPRLWQHLVQHGAS